MKFRPQTTDQRLQTKDQRLQTLTGKMLLVSFLLFLCSLCFALYTVAQDIQAEKTKETTAPLPKTETAATAPSEPAKNTVVEPVKAQDVPPGPAASDEKDQAAASGIMSLIEDDKDAAPQPIIINGDNIEYSTDAKNVTVTGNAEVDYKGTKLTSDKITMDTQTREGVADGNVRLEDAQGVIEGARLIYNFNTQKGTIFSANFRANPYFIKAKEVDKVSDVEFIARRGYMTTCSLDRPHYRFRGKRVNIFPGDKIQVKDTTFVLGQVPLVNIPHYTHSMRDPLMHVQLMGGKSREWGQYFLTAWRANLTDSVNGRIYFDYRAMKGVAEGFGTNYKIKGAGRGDFKYYYTQERDHKLSKANSAPRIFQRYIVRWRHKWKIDDRTDFISQYYKITDSKRAIYGSYYNVLKDYFFREYEKEQQPLSNFTIHHNFNYSSVDLLVQQRTNRWYSQAEYLPQVTYTLASIPIGRTPFYFANTTSYTNYNYKNAVPSPSWNDTTYNKVDISNKFNLPVKVAFFNLSPFVTAQGIYNDNANGLYHRTLDINLSCGSDISTKFYRVFNVKTNLLGLNINNLRHVITPSVAYSYNKNSTMQARKIRIGGGASTTDTNIDLQLSNKLQTKRKGESVDLVDFLVTTAYDYKPKTGDKRGSSFQDINFKLKVLPYSWLEINSDAVFKHTDKYAEGYRCFNNVNFDIDFKFSEERRAGYEQRYQRKGGNEQIYSFDWRFTPKWKFKFYQRFNRGSNPQLKRGLREQEYTLTRDFHCWEGSFTWNIKRGSGENIWLVFRLKAFPEMEFNYNQEYHVPKPGSQSNP